MLAMGRVPGESGSGGGKRRGMSQVLLGSDTNATTMVVMIVSTLFISVDGSSAATCTPLSSFSKSTLG